MHLVLDGQVTVQPVRGRALALGAGSLVGELAIAIAEELARRLRASVGDEPGATSP